VQDARFGRKDTWLVVVTALCVIALVVFVRWRTDGTSVLPPNPSQLDGPVDGSNPFRTGQTLVIPHGGGDGLFPENTLLAYERTMAMVHSSSPTSSTLTSVSPRTTWWSRSTTRPPTE